MATILIKLFIKLIWGTGYNDLNVDKDYASMK